MIRIKTEERPKKDVIANIVNLLINKNTIRLYDYNCNSFRTISENDFFLKPVFINNAFSFSYEIIFNNGIVFNEGNIFIPEIAKYKIPLDIVSGSSSFIDYLVYDDNTLIAMIEETKTDDTESRNTGIYQRGSKFIYANILFPEVPKYILYTNQPITNNIPSDTAIFGTKLLKTIGVEILGRNNFYNSLTPFTSIHELIEYKAAMRMPPASNIPILIDYQPWNLNIQPLDNTIYISGRLSKPSTAGNLAHDPNIGALTLIAGAIRGLGFNGEIYITHHGVSQNYINGNPYNKFLYIAKKLNINLYNINYTNTVYNYPQLRNEYVKNTVNSEKITSIFLHVILENSNLGHLIYENHAGCERGYFHTTNGILTLPKEVRGMKLYIPDLVMKLNNNNIILNIEGKKIEKLNQGIQELNNYNLIESEYINFYYQNNYIQRWVTTYGGNFVFIPHELVLIHINSDGTVLINPVAPLEVINAYNYFLNLNI